MNRSYVAALGILVILNGCSHKKVAPTKPSLSSNAPGQTAPKQPPANLKYIFRTTDTCWKAGQDDGCGFDSHGTYVIGSKVRVTNQSGAWVEVQGKEDPRVWVKKDDLIPVRGTELAVQKEAPAQAEDAVRSNEKRTLSVDVGENLVFVTQKKKDQCQINREDWVDCSSLSFDPKRVESAFEIEHYNAQRENEVLRARAEYDRLMGNPDFIYKAELAKDGGPVKEAAANLEKEMENPEYQECVEPPVIFYGLP